MIANDALAACAARRSTLLAAMGEGIALIPTSREAARNRDSLYPFRHDSYFYYLTGFAEPEAVLVLIAGKTPKSILFCREKNPEREIWDGYRYGPDGACATFGFDEARPITELAGALPQLLADQAGVYTFVGADPGWDKTITDALNGVRALVRTGVSAPSVVYDARALLDAQRLIKDAQEIALMRRAGEISSLAHVRAMERTRPGQYEYQVEAELLHEFVRSGAREQAYSAIVASGANACVLHYRENNRKMADGDLLLIDAGAEYDGYASDITRTFPVNGKYSPEQRDLYDVVLAAQLAAIEKARPGVPWQRVHDEAVHVATQGMIDLGILKLSFEQELEQEGYKHFYVHNTGHWLGLDVHDVGEYQIDGESRELEPGMVMTVEPGIYIPPNDTSVRKCFRGVGIRIEDDIAITKNEPLVLTGGLVKTADDIEALMAG